MDTNASPVYDIDTTIALYGVNSSTVGLYPTYNEGGVTYGIGPAIPLAWRVSPEKVSGDGLNPVTKIVGTEGHIQVVNGPEGYYPWLFMTELAQKYGKDSGDMGNYAKIERAGVGFQVSEGAFFPDNDSNHYLYFAADFGKALEQPNLNITKSVLTYKANLIIEAFLE